MFQQKKKHLIIQTDYTYLYLSVIKISLFLSFYSSHCISKHLSIDCVAECINNSRPANEQQDEQKQNRIEALWMHQYSINGWQVRNQYLAYLKMDHATLDSPLQRGTPNQYATGTVNAPCCRWRINLYKTFFLWGDSIPNRDSLENCSQSSIVY